MTMEELMQKIEAMIDAKIAALENVTEKAPEGDVKNEAMKSLQDEIDKLKGSLEGLIEQVKKPDLSNVDIDPDDPDPPKDAIKHDFKSLGHFAYDLINEGPDRNNVSAEMKDYRAKVYERRKATQTAGAGETGGTLIPTEFVTQPLERIKASNPVLTTAQIVPMESNSVEIPVIMGFDESQGKVFGNIQWYWKGEEDQLTGSNFLTSMVELKLNSCTGMARVSRDLMKYSASSIGAILDRGFEYGMSSAITRAAIRGTGVGQPKGVITAGPHRISVAKESGQPADTFILKNVGKMFARLYSPTDEIGAGTFFANRTVLPQLLELNTVVGTGGSNVFLMGNSVQGAPVYRLLGIPLRFNGQMSKIGDSGDAGLFDFSQYLVGQPAGGVSVESEQSIHLYFDYLSTAFRFVFDMGGQPWWPAEFKPEFGDSQTPFVILDERA